jgi:hypothetical protein
MTDSEIRTEEACPDKSVAWTKYPEYQNERSLQSFGPLEGLSLQYVTSLALVDSPIVAPLAAVLLHRMTRRATVCGLRLMLGHAFPTCDFLPVPLIERWISSADVSAVFVELLMNLKTADNIRDSILKVMPLCFASIPDEPFTSVCKLLGITQLPADARCSQLV